FDPIINYDLKQLVTHPLLKLDYKSIARAKTEEVTAYSAIFGQDISKWNKLSRSEEDQTIIIMLLLSRLTTDEVKLIFDNFPTTGKYCEHASKESYLLKSIEKAQAYIKDKEYGGGNILLYSGDEPLDEMITTEKVCYLNCDE